MVRKAPDHPPRPELKETTVQPRAPIEAPARPANSEPCDHDSAAPRKKPPAFQLYVKDWLASPKVRTMTLAEIGAYINLLATAWDSDPVATLPKSPASLCRLAGAASLEEWESVSPAVLANFEAQGDRLVNRRLQEVYQELVRHSQDQRDRANRRWEKDRKAPGTASAPRRSTPGTESAYAGPCSSTATAPAPAPATASSTAITEEKESVQNRNQWALMPNQSISGTAPGSGSDAALRLLDYFRLVSGRQDGDIVDFRSLLKRHPANLIQPALFWVFRTSNYWPNRLAGTAGFRHAFKKIAEQFKNYQAATRKHGGQAAVDKYLGVANNYGQAADADGAADEPEGNLSSFVIDEDSLSREESEGDPDSPVVFFDSEVDDEPDFLRPPAIEKDAYGQADGAADEPEGNLGSFVIDEDSLSREESEGDPDSPVVFFDSEVDDEPDFLRPPAIEKDAYGQADGAADEPERNLGSFVIDTL